MDPSRKAQGEELKVLHQTDADEDDENVKQLQECSILYLSLQECLAQTNRNWKSCQLELRGRRMIAEPKVQALKACHERRNRGKGK
ncbi:cytochrome c oxidase assembly factor 4, mitochondrial isoform X2 [Cinnamomum micranthum f. kanehirae]|uniref:Cytochrome c oxidase assembly factor 4, mitochondrial isoform X2 n=1 Tax=Cinnamomum micranthum f. kanehirae TaxID=337451 RepID=A0A3S3NBY4_9MAGN|nr:cytochrome c oxidase assembly factor 4, mitochondrial isoform X2 [Cinnamomum micranthum f. kanehirae]